APFAATFQAAAEELRHVRRDLTLEKAAVAQLTEDFDGIVLCRCSVAKRVQQGMPDFVDRALSIHPPDEMERALVDPVMTPRAGILQQIPDLAAIHMTGNTNMGTQTRMQARDAIPAGAEQGVHGPIRSRTRV